MTSSIQKMLLHSLKSNHIAAFYFLLLMQVIFNLISHAVDIMLDRLELESQLPLHFSDPHFKQLFNKKLPNIPYDFACNIKTFMHQKPLLLNQVIEIVGILEKPVVAGPIEDFGLIEMLPVIHCIHHEPIDLLALCPEVEESPETGNDQFLH